MDKIKRDWLGPIYTSHGTNNSCGTANLINPRHSLNILSTSRDRAGSVISINFDLEEHNISLTNIYAPRTDSECSTFFTSLPKFLTDHNIIAGDYNCITDPRLDKLGGNPHARNYANDAITQMMKDYALRDIWRELNKTKRIFTWTGKTLLMAPLSPQELTKF